MIHICPIEIAAVLGMVPVIPYLIAKLRSSYANACQEYDNKVKIINVNVNTSSTNTKENNKR